MDRRHFLRTSGLGLAGLGIAGRAAPAAASVQSLELVAAPLPVAWEGRSYDAWALNGSLPAPVLRFRRGDRARLTLRNGLPEPTILHWHGLDVPEAADGHPRLAIDPGETYDYAFDVVDPSGTYWYHPHTHGRTGAQTYAGMAGLLVIDDDEADALPLPPIEAEIPLILQDRRTGDRSPFDHRPGMGPDIMLGYLGDTPFANGVAGAEIPVTRGVHRLRLLNACNARLLDLGLSSREPMTLVGADGGLLPSAVTIDRIMIGTGERLDLLVDFSGYPPGTRIALRSFEFTIPGMMSPGGMGPGGRGPGGMGGRGPMGGGRGRGMGMGGLPQGTGMDFAHFVVGDERGAEPRPLPAALVRLDEPSLNADTPRRTFRFESAMMRHTINGRAFAMDRVDTEVRRGRTEVWTIVNDTGFAHPVHVHACQFRVLSRSGGRGIVMPWERGRKDTVLMLPGERVEIAVRFDRYPGVFLMHCHNLEHEDAGMMSNFRVLE